MLGGVIAALRWGLPSDHPAAQEPALTLLTLQFDRFDHYLHAQLRWKSTDVPEMLSYEQFASTGQRDGGPDDLWRNRFLALTHAMRDLAGVDQPEDPQHTYERYRHWLPFAFRVQQLVAAISRDLDYQPVLRRGEQAPDATADTGPEQPLHRGGDSHRSPTSATGCGRRCDAGSRSRTPP